MDPRHNLYRDQGWMDVPGLIIDLFHRKVVGRSVGDNWATKDTIMPKWNMAISSNAITNGPMFHSDWGSQYASRAFTDILKKHGGLVEQGMGRKGGCRDNAVAEPFFKSLWVEWSYKHDYGPRSGAELSIFQWIGTW